MPRKQPASTEPAAAQSEDERPLLREAIRRGLEFLARQQQDDGSWRGDYGGPMFLLPMYVAAGYVCQQVIPADRRERMRAYLIQVQNEDGSIGLHAEAREGTVFTTVLTYVALRMLGANSDDPELTRMRQWILSRGGPLGAASWGKWILAVLNLYDYRGLVPVLPELYVLPYWLPFHPGRLWCHTRQVYLPASYLYATRARIPEDALIRQLRGELYNQSYETIRFDQHRHTVADCDQLSPTSWAVALANRASLGYERAHLPWLRRRALAKVVDHLQYEDRVTHFIRLGPVNAALNTIVHWFQGADREVLGRSWQGLSQYLCDGHDGLKMNGYISSSLWDTSFVAQTILAGPFAADYGEVLDRAHGYIRNNQITDQLPERRRYYRDISKGGWGFGDAVNGWPVTDCTAEGLKVALELEGLVRQPLPEDRMRDAIRLLLAYQNGDGGWATYERRRAGTWLECLNPSQVFREIMVDDSYTECTSACMQTLVHARERFAGEFDREIDRAVARGSRFLRQRQRADGSWEGSWGICFTYGTWFGVNGLLAAGIPRQAPNIQRAVDFLRRHQNADGGWGEDYESCARGSYISRDSLAVNTAWTLLTLAAAGEGSSEAARGGARFLIERQQGDGDWPREAMVGIFNKTAVINYENYRRYFCIWALSALERCL